MFKKTAHYNQENNLKFSFANVTDEYITVASENTHTGDGHVDIHSGVINSLPQSVASLIKDSKVESLFNGHAGLKATNIQIEADLEGKKIGEEWLLARMRAIDACGYEKIAGSIPPKGNDEDLHGANANADYFSEEELLREEIREGKKVRAFETFVGCPFFTNHKNDDISLAKGKIINAFYDLEDHCVYTDVMVDAVAYPELARGIKEGIMQSVSMGTAVKYSICSVCGKKASEPSEYCTHIRNSKGKTVEGKKVYEINHGLKFIELSQVVDGACSNCKVINKCMDPEELLDKVANVNKALLKISNKKQTNYKELEKEFYEAANNFTSNVNSFLKHFSFKKSVGFKYASKQDLENLHSALKILQEITVKIITSSEVDYEFAADLTKILEQLQKFIIDLTEAGFGDLQDEAGANSGAGADPSLEGDLGNPPAGDQGVAPMPGGNAPDPVGTTQGLGFESPINEMQLSANSNQKLNIFANKITNLIDKLESHYDNIRQSSKKEALAKINRGLFAKKTEENKVNLQNKISQNWHKLINKELGLMKSLIEVSEGNYTIRIANNQVSGIHDGEEFSANLDELPKNIVEAYKENPNKAATMILSSWKNGGITSEAYQKNPPPQTEVQEGQLESLDGNFKRVRPLHEEDYSVTEGRLDEFPISSYTGEIEYKKGNGEVVGTGEDRFTRKNYEDLPVSEGRLDSLRTNDMHVADRAIQEGQLSGVDTVEFGRWTNDQRGNDVPTTEGQLAGESPYQSAEKDRIGYAVDEVQEGQLRGKRQGPDAYMSATAAAKSLIKSAAKTVIERGITPSQIIKSLEAIANYKNILGGYIRTANNNNKLAKENLVRRLTSKASNNEVSENEIATMVLDNIVSSVNYDIPVLNDYNKYLNKAASFLINNADKTKVAIKKEVNKELEKIKETSEDKNSNCKVKEEMEKEAFNQVFEDGNNSEKHIVEFFNDELEDSTLEELVANTLTDSGLIVSASNVSATVIGKDKDTGICVAEVTINETPNDEDSKLALAMSVLRKIAQTPPSGSQFQGTGDQPAPEGAPGGGVGALTTPPPDFSPSEGGETEDFDSDEDMDSEGPQFPGDMCPSCGSHDVETLEDSTVCKNCNLEYNVEVNVKILNVKKTLDDADGGEDVGMEGDDMPMPEETGMAPVSQPGAPAMQPFPARASMTISPLHMIRTANSLGRLPRLKEAVAIGHRCPNCGSGKVNFESNNGQCLSCSSPYIVAFKNQNNGLIKATINWMSSGSATNLFKEQDNCKDCAASVNKFAKKVASLKSNHTNLVNKLSERLQKQASINPENAAIIVCQEDRMNDGFSKEASCEICKSLNLAIKLENKKAQNSFEEDEEANEVENLENPMEESGELDEVEIEISDDLDSDEEVEIELDVEDDTDSDEEFIDNLPEDILEDDTSENSNIKLDVNVSTENGDSEVQLEIDPETGEVSVISESEFSDDLDTDIEDFDGDDDIIDIVDDEEVSDSIFDDEGAEEVDDEDVEVIDEDSDDEDEDSPVGNELDTFKESVEEDDEEDSFGTETVGKSPEDVGMGSLAMSNSRILSQNRFAGNNLDISKIAETLGLTKKSIKVASDKRNKQHPLLRESANIKIKNQPNMLANTKLAQNAPNQTQPLDVEDEVDAGVPRDESVGLKQTQPKKVNEVFEKGYERGKNKNTTKVVPRDNSGDGLGGKKVTFENENANKQTSGNPDNYVQTLVEQTKPVPSGNKENKATASYLKDAIMKLAERHDLDVKNFEAADCGNFYLVANNGRIFKVPMNNKVTTASSNEERVVRFKGVTATIKPNGDIVKACSESAGNTVKPNPADGKKNKGVMPVNKGVATASEDCIKPNPVDGKKNKGVTPKNKGYNTAGKEECNGNPVKPNPVDGKKNKGVTPTNKGVATAGEDCIEPNKPDGKKNKLTAPSKKTANAILNRVASKTNSNVKDLRISFKDNSYIVANVKNNKKYRVK